MKRSLKRGVVIVGGTVFVASLFLSGNASSQIPPPPTLPPGFTFPSFPPPPTMPPPTMPVPTTTPPPTMPPPTSTPPPTMPPPTSPPSNNQIDQEIQDIIDRLASFGNRFQDIINDLRALQSRF